MKPNESHIITHILAGKTEEFSYFLDTYGQQVFALIVRMVSSPEYAEELTQDTFMKAFQHLGSFSAESSFSTWIYRIAYNTALSALRKKKEEVLVIDDFSTWIYRIAYNTALSALRKKKEEVLVIDDKQWERVSETEIDEALDDESEERIARLQAALEKLSAEERAIIAFFYEEEKCIEDIAHILNQSVGNIKVKLHRIRKKLYILMSEEE